MSNQENNEASKLPIAPLIKPDITEGVIPLPPTSLLGEAERKRLDELAASPQATPSDPEETLCVFEDGATVKFFERKGYAPQCLLVDASGKVLAIVKDANIADFLANAVNTFVIATAKNNDTDNPIQIATKPIILPGPGAN